MKHLEEIKARIRDCSTYNFGMHNANKLAHEDAPRMVEALEAVMTPPTNQRSEVMNLNELRRCAESAIREPDNEAEEFLARGTLWLLNQHEAVAPLIAAKALREAADAWWQRMDEPDRHGPSSWLRDRADNLEARK